jgi:hypothetical protein
MRVWGATMGPAPADAGVTQLVECDLAKVDVAGSNPVSRSKFSKTLILFAKFSEHSPAKSV